MAKTHGAKLKEIMNLENIALTWQQKTILKERILQAVMNERTRCRDIVEKQTPLYTGDGYYVRDEDTPGTLRSAAQKIWSGQEPS